MSKASSSLTGSSSLPVLPVVEASPSLRLVSEVAAACNAVEMSKSAASHTAACRAVRKMRGPLSTQLTKHTAQGKDKASRLHCGSKASPEITAIGCDQTLMLRLSDTLSKESISRTRHVGPQTQHTTPSLSAAVR